jgi:hypothetical protein
MATPVWEVLESRSSNTISIETARMSVPGGWLVRFTTFMMHKQGCTTAASSAVSGHSTTNFVEDPEHKWSLE